jgi:hypothetical protein
MNMVASTDGFRVQLDGGVKFIGLECLITFIIDFICSSKSLGIRLGRGRRSLGDWYFHR